MTARRLLKAAEAIREVVSMAVLTEIRDPRVKGVTVTQVAVAPDMRSAKIYVSIMGDPQKESLCLRGLEHAAGFLQHKIAERIDTRYTPRLFFVLDKGVKNALEVSRILQEVLPPKPVADDDESAAESVSDESHVETDAAAPQPHEPTPGA